MERQTPRFVKGASRALRQWVFGRCVISGRSACLSASASKQGVLMRGGLLEYHPRLHLCACTWSVALKTSASFHPDVPERHGAYGSVAQCEVLRRVASCCVALSCAATCLCSLCGSSTAGCSFEAACPPAAPGAARTWPGMDSSAITAEFKSIAGQKTFVQKRSVPRTGSLPALRGAP